MLIEQLKCEHYALVFTHLLNGHTVADTQGYFANKIFARWQRFCI